MVITEFLKEMLPYVFGQMVLPAPDDDREKVHTIFQPAQGEQAIPSVAHVVGICVALKVPYFISMEILGAAGIKLRSTAQDFLYRQFLLNAENLTVSRCEDILKQHSEKPLFRGEQR